jgi:hypothetical protein
VSIFTAWHDLYHCTFMPRELTMTPGVLAGKGLIMTRMMPNDRYQNRPLAVFVDALLAAAAVLCLVALVLVVKGVTAPSPVLINLLGLDIVATALNVGLVLLAFAATVLIVTWFVRRHL